MASYHGGKIKDLLLRLTLVSVLAMIPFILSCSRIPSTLSSTSPTTPKQLIPSPTTELPIISTWEDLYSLRNYNPANIDNSKLPITPVESLDVIGNTPDVGDIANYMLSVDGVVDTPLKLSYDAILKYPTVSETLLLICPGTFADNAEWTGVPVATLLAEAGVKPGASKVTFYALDQYVRTFSLTDVQQDGVFLAYKVNGQTLPKEHGYPIRLVVKGMYGAYWVRWVYHIQIE